MNIHAIFALGNHTFIDSLRHKNNFSYDYVFDIFGVKNSGSLPWGSFPEELSVYESLLEYNCVKDDRQAFITEDQAVFVGYNTWNTLPNSAKNTIINASKRVFVFTKTFWLHKLDNNKVVYVNNLPSTMEEVELLTESLYIDRVVVLGGMSIIEQMYKNRLINKMFISLISFIPEQNQDYICSDILKIGDLMSGATYTSYIAESDNIREPVTTGYKSFATLELGFLYK